MKHAREGLPIPLEWALDPDGRPTTDPEIALKGSMAPSGGYNHPPLLHSRADA
jgi:(2R)-3-sulfolactate dehydrogenase (NADP+)